MLAIDLSPDSSVHLNKRGKQNQVSSRSRFDLHSPKAFYRCFRKQYGHVLCLLFKEACLYASTDWLSSSVNQRLARCQLNECCINEELVSTNDLLGSLRENDVCWKNGQFDEENFTVKCYVKTCSCSRK